MTTYEGKPAVVLTSTSGSSNVLHIVDDGDGVIFFDAWNGKKGIGIHTTPEAITHAFRDLGLGVTTLQEAEALRTRVEEVEREAKALHEEIAPKLDAIAAVLDRKELDSGEEVGDDAIEALQEIYNILHPAPPYTFPTKLGAVVRARNGNQVAQYQLTDDSETRTWVSHRGDWLTEAQVRAAFTDFETITEGIDE